MDGISESKQATFIAAQPVMGPRLAVPAFWPCLVLAFAATCITAGIMWDISWHETIGRDSFWTPAHMCIYLGGVLGGCVGGWLAIQHTFLSGARGADSSVRVFGARAPLGAWVAIWGALAMVTSAPFDNWWHNAYGLDVKIISPPHSLLGLGMFGISFGALLLVLTRQNRLQNGEGSGLFIYVAGVFVVMVAVFIMEYDFPNRQHGMTFYVVSSLMFPIRLATIGRAARTSWPVTRAAMVYLLFVCAMIWILPLFPAQPKLAPIFNPVTHMVPPPFPLLLVFPAIAMDLILRWLDGKSRAWDIPLAVLVGTAFLAVFMAVQWYFSEFLLSPLAENGFFVGNRVWAYGDQLGHWTREFWDEGFNLKWLSIAWILAVGASWLGLLLGGWMRKVQR